MLSPLRTNFYIKVIILLNDILKPLTLTAPVFQEFLNPIKIYSNNVHLSQMKITTNKVSYSYEWKCHILQVCWKGKTGLRSTDSDTKYFFCDFKNHKNILGNSHYSIHSSSSPWF